MSGPNDRDAPRTASTGGRRATWLVVSCLLGLLAFVGWRHRSDIAAWIAGYELIWMGPDIVPVDVNARGVAATYREIIDESLPAGARREAGTWRAAERTFHRLDPPLGALPSFASQAINDRGDVLGHDLDNQMRPRSGILWRADGRAVRFEAPNGEALIPLDLNERAEVVGVWYEEASNLVGSRAFLWSEDTGFVDLNTTLGYRWSQANAINNHGWVTGWVAEDDALLRRPFRWRGGRIELLDSPTVGSRGAVAIEVNDRGDALVNTLGQNAVGPFLWRDDGVLERIPPPDGRLRTIGLVLDEGGDVLLWSPSDDDERFAIFRRGAFVSLPDVPGADDSKRSALWRLGSGGWLAGTVWLAEPDGRETRHAFLLRLVR